ncbi:MAG: hypothetical protein AB7S57_13685 [Acetobacteraceae bacterium]
MDHGAREKRQRQPHQQGRQQQGREYDADDRKPGLRDADQLHGDQVIEDVRAQCGAGCNGDFARRECQYGPGPGKPVGEARGHKAADAEAKQKSRNHDGGGNGVRAAEQPQHPLPRNLIYERAESRHEEGNVQQSEGTPGGMPDVSGTGPPVSLRHCYPPLLPTSATAHEARGQSYQCKSIGTMRLLITNPVAYFIVDSTMFADLDMLHDCHYRTKRIEFP